MLISQSPEKCAEDIYKQLEKLLPREVKKNLQALMFDNPLTEIRNLKR